MQLFWVEFFNYIASIFAILVCISSALLFFAATKHEKLLKTSSRAIGFSILAAGFLFLILERKYSILGVAGVVLEYIGFLFIYKGVLAEPSLVLLRKGDISYSEEDKNETSFQIDTDTEKQKLQWKIGNFLIIIPTTLLVIISILAFIIYGIQISSYVLAAFSVGTIIFIAATMIIQIRRYIHEKDNPNMRLQNLWPLLAYIFLLLREVTMVLYRLPSSDIVTISSMRLNFGYIWDLSIVFTFLGFIFLAIWAWNFIKVRKQLRTYVMFFSVITLLSTLGSLVFTSLVFKVVENNNYELMRQGADTETLIMLDRSNNSLFVAKTIANDEKIIANVEKNNYEELLSQSTNYYENSGVDVIRIYSIYGEVLVSPNDPRDKGKMFNEDDKVSYTIREKSQVKSFDMEQGVLSPTIVCRSIYPIVDGNKIVGAVEVGYKFDDAFVDFSKRKTGLDVTIFTDKTRSATTIMTEDGVNRWKGSEVVDQDIIDTVLNNGKNFKTQEVTLEKNYYNSYVPIRDMNGKIIGMTAVGNPTNKLFEETRQELITAFLIVSMISLIMTFLVARIGYFSTKKEEILSK